MWRMGPCDTRLHNVFTSEEEDNYSALTLEVRLVSPADHRPCVP